MMLKKQIILQVKFFFYADIHSTYSLLTWFSLTSYLSRSPGPFQIKYFRKIKGSIKIHLLFSVNINYIIISFEIWKKWCIKTTYITYETYYIQVNVYEVRYLIYIYILYKVNTLFLRPSIVYINFSFSLLANMIDMLYWLILI